MLRRKKFRRRGREEKTRKMIYEGIGGKRREMMIVMIPKIRCRGGRRGEIKKKKMKEEEGEGVMMRRRRMGMMKIR